MNSLYFLLGERGEGGGGEGESGRGGGQVGTIILKTMGASKPLPENKSPEDSNHFPEDDQDRIQTIVWIRITKRFKPLS